MSDSRVFAPVERGPRTSARVYLVRVREEIHRTRCADCAALASTSLIGSRPTSKLRRKLRVSDVERTHRGDVLVDEEGPFALEHRALVLRIMVHSPRSSGPSRRNRAAVLDDCSPSERRWEHGCALSDAATRSGMVSSRRQRVGEG